MADFIDKTTYLAYRQCPKNAWLLANKPELHALFELSEFERSLSVMGHEVELMAQKLFPDGVAIRGRGKSAAELTRLYIDAKAPVIYQPTFIYEKFLARADVMVYDQENEEWNLYEIKASTSLKSTHKVDFIEDVSFQYAIIRSLGVNLGKIFIVYLNKEYVRGEEIDINQLFIKKDVTELVYERMAEMENRMSQAQKDIFEKPEREMICNCIYEGRSAECTTFAYSHPEVSTYSVHDLYRIGSSKKRLRSLIQNGIYNLKDIPQDFELNKIQGNQLKAYLNKKPLIDLEAIKKELSGLEYPLYFLDYETYASAIPLFKGFHPFEHIPFQFSLDVVNSRDGKIDNFEYLHQADDDPSDIIVNELRSFIGSKGSIIVWNKSFEQSINKRLMERNPTHREFLEDLNRRIYDLMDIFTDQLYVHPDFQGKASLKKILPVLVPDLTYYDLDIKEGATASEKWREMIFGDLVPSEKEKVMQDLMQYCGRDTVAMYAIWKFLITTIE